MKQITKHASFYVPNPICFGTEVPSSGSLLTTKNHYVLVFVNVCNPEF